MFYKKVLISALLFSNYVYSMETCVDQTAQATDQPTGHEPRIFIGLNFNEMEIQYTKLKGKDLENPKERRKSCTFKEFQEKLKNKLSSEAQKYVHFPNQAHVTLHNNRVSIRDEEQAEAFFSGFKDRITAKIELPAKVIMPCAIGGLCSSGPYNIVLHLPEFEEQFKEVVSAVSKAVTAVPTTLGKILHKNYERLKGKDYEGLLSKKDDSKGQFYHSTIIASFDYGKAPAGVDITDLNESYGEICTDYQKRMKDIRVICKGLTLATEVPQAKGDMKWVQEIFLEARGLCQLLKNDAQETLRIIKYIPKIARCMEINRLYFDGLLNKISGYKPSQKKQFNKIRKEREEELIVGFINRIQDNSLDQGYLCQFFDPIEDNFEEINKNIKAIEDDKKDLSEGMKNTLANLLKKEKGRKKEQVPENSSFNAIIERDAITAHIRSLIDVFKRMPETQLMQLDDMTQAVQKKLESSKKSSKPVNSLKNLMI